MAKLKINRGTTYTIGVNYQKNGAPTSLVGATIRFTMKNEEFDNDTTDNTATVMKNVANGNADGYAEIKILPQDTATAEPGNYYYDIKVDETSDGTNIFKIDEGKITLDGSPTNRL